jgi:hypothetical protein
MLGTGYQKRERARRRHIKAMEAIYSKRDDICRNCVFFKDGRFCVNPEHAEGNVWADQKHVVGTVQVTATQGCDLFKRGKPPEIRPADPAEEAERTRYALEERAIWDSESFSRKEERRQLEERVQNRLGYIRGIKDLNDELLHSLLNS